MTDGERPRPAAAGMALHRLGEIAAQAPVGWKAVWYRTFVAPASESLHTMTVARLELPEGTTLEDLVNAQLAAWSRCLRNAVIEEITEAALRHYRSVVVCVRWLGDEGPLVQCHAYVKPAQAAYRVTSAGLERDRDEIQRVFRRLMASIRGST